MHTDKELLASEKQAITETAVSLDSILMTGLVGADRSRNLRVFAQVEGALTGGAATGITVEMIQADNAALTTNVEVLGSTGNIANGSGGANVAAGRRLVDQPLPATTKPYFGFRYTPAGGSYGSGVITAGIVLATGTPTAQRPVANTNGF